MEESLPVNHVTICSDQNRRSVIYADPRSNHKPLISVIDKRSQNSRAIYRGASTCSASIIQLWRRIQGTAAICSTTSINITHSDNLREELARETSKHLVAIEGGISRR